MLSSNILLKLNELISSSARLYFPKWLQRCFHLPCTSRIFSLCFLPACADWAFVTVWTTRMWQKWCTLRSQARLGQVALCLELSTLGIRSPGFNKPRSRGPSSRPVADARHEREWTNRIIGGRSSLDDCPVFTGKTGSRSLLRLYSVHSLGAPPSFKKERNSLKMRIQIEFRPS